ncbi:MAG: hypothetical protein KatS3mg019_0050 [Fimbriimonadales bacterium]|nr:MAG: hypothetical protein KatS3mg019_0050 [Fimbriimonadales bacterium]
MSLQSFKLSRWVKYETAFRITYAIYDVFALTLFFSMLYCWLRFWHPRGVALLGALFACATAPIAYRHHYFQPWSLIEAALFTLGLMLIVTRRDREMVALVFISTLVRETAILLVIAHGLFHVGLRRSESKVGSSALFWTALSFSVWAMTYIGLRFGLGNAPHVESLAEIAGTNFSSENLIMFSFYIFLMFGGFLVYAKRGFRIAPEPLRRLSAVLPFYLALMAVWAIWKEVRCFMPLYSLIIPLGLYYIRPLVQDMPLVGQGNHSPQELRGE